MSTIDLPALARQAGVRRNVTLRPIEPTQSHAQELAALYFPIIRTWQRADILAGYSPDLTQDAPADHQAAMDRVEGEVSRLVYEFGAGVQSWALRVEAWSRRKWTASVKSGLGIDLGTILSSGDVATTVEATIAANVDLVKDVSAQIRQRISGSVFRGYQNKTPARQVAKEIAEATQLARKRSLRIASDQLNKFTAAIDRERRADAGITKYKYQHSGKRHPREEHQARDGYVYEAKSGKPVNGGPVIPANDRAGMAPYCGCREQGYIDLQLELENA